LAEGSAVFADARALTWRGPGHFFAPPGAAIAQYVLRPRGTVVHHHRLGDTTMKKKDNTELIRVRQSFGQNKAALVVCALLAIAGLVGWLTALG
jgi:hypothetical protein